MRMVDETIQQKLPALAVEFFVKFSRFECAMKRTGIYAVGDEQDVQPDWDKLAADLGRVFFARVVESGIAVTLIKEPPKKQIKQNDGSLGWRDMGAVVNTFDLLLAIRRARNNLVHGGKYRDTRTGSYDDITGTERSNTLLSESLAVLELALDHNAKLMQEFFIS
jgi:hypothetical protein